MSEVIFEHLPEVRGLSGWREFRDGLLDGLDGGGGIAIGLVGAGEGVEEDEVRAVGFLRGDFGDFKGEGGVAEFLGSCREEGVGVGVDEGGPGFGGGGEFLQQGEAAAGVRAGFGWIVEFDEVIAGKDFEQGQPFVDDLIGGISRGQFVHDLERAQRGGERLGHVVQLPVDVGFILQGGGHIEQGAFVAGVEAGESLIDGALFLVAFERALVVEHFEPDVAGLAD